jgi:hypothetical protein
MIQDLDLVKVILSRINSVKEDDADKSFLREIKLEISGFSRSKKCEVKDLALL